MTDAPHRRSPGPLLLGLALFTLAGARLAENPQPDAAPASRPVPAPRAAAPAPDAADFSDRTPCGDATAVSLIDRDTGAPIAAASVRLRPARAAGSAMRELAAATGGWLVPAACRGACVLEVHSPGYVPLVGELDIEDGSNRVALQRGGHLRVRAQDGDGRPVAGVRIALQPPADDAPSPALVQTHGVWRAAGGTAAAVADRERTSDAGGELSWTDLPPGDGWRWQLESAQHVAVDPPHENHRLAEVD